MGHSVHPQSVRSAEEKGLRISPGTVGFALNFSPPRMRGV